MIIGNSKFSVNNNKYKQTIKKFMGRVSGQNIEFRNLAVPLEASLNYLRTLP